MSEGIPPEALADFTTAIALDPKPDSPDSPAGDPDSRDIELPPNGTDTID